MYACLSFCLLFCAGVHSIKSHIEKARIKSYDSLAEGLKTVFAKLKSQMANVSLDIDSDEIKASSCFVYALYNSSDT
jgi:hypothetical protein